MLGYDLPFREMAQFVVVQKGDTLADVERERQRARQAADAANIAKPRWGTPEARLEARRELQRRIGKAREQGGTKEK